MLQVLVSADGEFKERKILCITHVYLTLETYPKGCTQSVKRQIRLRVVMFEVIDRELFYKQSANKLLQYIYM